MWGHTRGKPQVRFCNKQAWSRAFENDTYLTCPNQRRRRYSHSPDTEYRKQRGNEVRTIQQPQNHAVARFDAALAQGTCHFHDFLPQLGVSNDGMVEVDRRRSAAAMLEVDVQQLVTGVQRIGI